MTHTVHQASWESQELATFAKTQTTSTKLNISIPTLIIRIKNGLIMNAHILPFMLLTPHLLLSLSYLPYANPVSDKRAFSPMMNSPK